MELFKLLGSIGIENPKGITIEGEEMSVSLSQLLRVCGNIPTDSVDYDIDASNRGYSRDPEEAYAKLIEAYAVPSISRYTDGGDWTANSALHFVKEQQLFTEVSWVDFKNEVVDGVIYTSLVIN